MTKFGHTRPRAPRCGGWAVLVDSRAMNRTTDIIDLTVRVSLAAADDAKANESKARSGHLGTHFDVMNFAGTTGLPCRVVARLDGEV